MTKRWIIEVGVFTVHSSDEETSLYSRGCVSKPSYLNFFLYIILFEDVRSHCWLPGAFAHLTQTPDTVELAFESGFMTYPSLFPGKSPLSGSQSSTAENHFVPESRESGEVISANIAENAQSVANAQPVAKPWAHFVAGGYVTSYQHIFAC